MLVGGSTWATVRPTAAGPSSSSVESPPRPLSTPLLLLLAGSAAALQSGQLSRQDQSQQILEFNNEGLRHVRLQLFFSFFSPRCPLVTNGSCVDAMCSRH